MPYPIGKPPDAPASYPTTFKGFVPEVRMLIELLGDGAIGVPSFLERCTRLTHAAIRCSRTGI